jgi:hypothetical protein
MHDRLALPPTFPSASPRTRRRVRLAGVAQLVEHLLCKQVVGGSSPPASSTKVGPGPHRSTRLVNGTPEGCPSGQREQAVNLPAHAYVGSNPTPSTKFVGVNSADEAALPTRGSEFFVVRQASDASRQSQVKDRPRRSRRFVVGRAAARADRDLFFQDSELDVGAAVAARVSGLRSDNADLGTRRGDRLAAGPTAKRLGRFARMASSSSFNFAGVAQLVERQPSKLNVEGSSPFSRSTGLAHLAQLVEHVLGKDEVTSSTLVVGSKGLYGGKGLGNSKGVGK